MKNSFQTPDFAYPQDVVKNAQAEYDKALAAGDGLNALRAAIQMNIAQIRIDAEGDVSKSLARYQELGTKLAAPWNSMAYLLQARLYTDIYQNESWVFDGRTLPLDNYPENIQEWSGAMFAAKTLETVRNALKAIDGSGTKPLKDISGLLDNYGGAESAGMTVGDFVRLYGAEILSAYCRSISDEPLRFGNDPQSETPQEQCFAMRKAIYDLGLQQSEAAGNVSMASMFAWQKYENISYTPKKRQFLHECYDKFGNTEWGARYVSAYAEDLQDVTGSDGKSKDDAELNTDRRKALQILESYSKQFPTAPGGTSIPYQIADLRTQSVEMSLPARVLPDTQMECTVKAKNVYDLKLLFYKVPDEIEDNIRLTELVAKGKLVRTVPLTMKGATPDVVKDSITLQGLKPGNYVLLPSADGTFNGVIRDRNDKYANASIFQVTDMSYFISNDEKGSSLFIVDAVNQQPLAGVTVHVSERVYNGKGRTWNLVTDKDGCVELPNRYVVFRVKRGESYVSNDIYGQKPEKSLDWSTTYRGQIMTDLSIYKPGQEIGFVGILGLKNKQRLSEVKRREVIFTLINANGEKIDSIETKTDDWGRATGHFTVPSDGLLGSYRIDMALKDTALMYQRISDAMIKVADYKSPTFRVVTEKLGAKFTLGDTLNIKGKALTYSGMPVVGGKVAYTVKYEPWSFWWRYGSNRSAQVSGTTQTDANGGFDIVLPTETIRGTAYEKGVFTLTVAVTDEAGETHEADPVRFSFASAYSIKADVPETICVDGNVDVQSVGSVKITDMVGAPVERDIYYVVRDSEGKDVLKGECRPGKLQFDLAKLKSGSYSILFALNPEMKSDDECGVVTENTVIWRTSDKTPAVRTSLWVPVKDFVAKPGEKTLSVPVGSSYKDSYIYCRVDNGSELLRSEWLKVSDGIVKIKVEAPDSLQRIYLHLIGMRDFDSKTATVTIVPEVQREQVEISTESFRDKMAPGDEEVWKFRFTIGGRPMVQRPVMAVMSNKSLNALAPFQWSLDIPNCINWSSIVNMYGARVGWWCSNDFRHSMNVKNSFKQMFDVPHLNTYDKLLYGGSVFYDLYSVKEEAIDYEEVANAAPVSESVPMQSRGGTKMAARMFKNQMASADTEADAGAVVEPEKEELRPVEMPLAFFMPDLLTDGDGVATVNFLVPNFNGTWQFQIAGYTSDLKGGVSVLDAVATKQVMVQMNAPRFLRTGDKAQVSATLFNNSDGVLPVAGRIDILDADGNVLKSQEFTAEELNASGQRTVTVDYDVPANMSEVQIRAYAMGGRHRDGEGVTVAVLPSSTPVIDSKTFYAGPGAQTIKVEQPKNAKDATVTLQYCGNPIWECITSLPSILQPESTSILVQVRALYGNAIAQGLIKKYPQIGEALKTFSAPENAGDSTLVSNLQKNQQLKAVTLTNTPWVNNANDETRRMQSLVEYLDTVKSAEAIAAIMKVLKERQNNDGGWSWCPDMPTSTYITGRVLLHFAMLKGMGYLPDGAGEMADKAFAYMDSELAKSWEMSQRKYVNVSLMLNYLYLKSFFPEVKDEKSFVPLRRESLKSIETGWKELDIYDKATAVTLEYRLKNRALAASILESLRQYAKVTPDKGMCFENLKGVFSGWNPLITTAQVLEAYGEAAPSDAAVDQLRQWLLMSKQTQDWGAMNAAKVVQALLSTGSDWTVPGDVAKVMAGGKELEVPARARITDSFTLTLTPEQVKKGDIRIEKSSAGPAWGGVVSQYVAPILDVRSEGVPQLRIEKNVYSIDGSKAEAGNLKVGDRVRVTLSITTDRDMDYVAVIDNRSACLEPADQLSGYTASDGVWMYREVRNTQTNLFIPFLPKGTSVISYECFVDRAGEYTLGIAQAQSQYAPVISAHSAGVKLTVKK